MNGKFIVLLLLLFFCLPLVYPFLEPGYPKTHDGLWAVMRLAEMKRELSDGQFPPRWSSYLNHGFGYPLFLFTYPLPYYFGAVISYAGISLVMTLKILFMATIIGSAFSMYAFAHRLWGRWGGLFSAVLYLYMPYRIVNLYIRGSLGELLAWVWYPLLFLYSWQAVKSFKSSAFIISGCLIALLILSHNASTVLFLPFLGLWILGSVQEQRVSMSRRLQTLIGICTIGFGLAASFWLPAIIEKQFIILSQVPLTDKALHFIPLQVLLGGAKHPITNLPLTLGLLPLVLAIGVLVWFRSDPHRQIRLTLFIISGLTLISIFMVLPYSQFLWKAPILRDLDFPWRMLGVCGFFLALIGGKIADSSRWGMLVSVLFGLLVVFVSTPHIIVSGREYQPDTYYQTNDATTTSNDELMPLGVSEKPTNQPEAKVASDSELRIQNLKSQSQRFSFTVFSNQEKNVTVNALYFPGWKARIGAQVTPITVVPKSGLMNVVVPKGEHMIEFLFERTFVRKLADSISILSFGFVIVWIFSKRLFRIS